MGWSGNRHGKREPDLNKSGGLTRREAFAIAALGLVAAAPGEARAAGPEGQLTWGVHISLAPTWFDPAETPGIITPFMVMYALHDAVVKPMPGNPQATCLAESFSASEDGLSYEFVLRNGAKFHNGDPVTAEDVRFSFERYRGTSHDLMKDGGAVDVLTPPRPLHPQKTVARFPDLLASATSAMGVPKKYVETVGDEVQKAPIGAGPTNSSRSRLASSWSWAFDQYWRKTPASNASSSRSFPTRRRGWRRSSAAGRHRYSDPRRRAEELAHPGLSLESASAAVVYFPEQWDPKSPWHDERVTSASLLDRKTINGADPRPLLLSNSIIGQLRLLLAAAGPVATGQSAAAISRSGPPTGSTPESSHATVYANVGEAILDNLQAVSIRVGFADRAGGLCQGIFRENVEEYRVGRQRRIR
jgi:peptide/nickel transport system substrate-binding protein